MFISIIFYFLAPYLLKSKKKLQNFKLIDKWELDKRLEWKWKSNFFSISMVRKSSIKRCCYESVNTGGFVVLQDYLKEKYSPASSEILCPKSVWNSNTKTKDFETNNVTIQNCTFLKVLEHFWSFADVCVNKRPENVWNSNTILSLTKSK